jgi:hypothetical protein
MKSRIAVTVVVLLALCGAGDAFAGPSPAPAAQSNTPTTTPAKSAPEIDIPSVPIIQDTRYQNILQFCQSASHLADIRSNAPAEPAAPPVSTNTPQNRNKPTARRDPAHSAQPAATATPAPASAETDKAKVLPGGAKPESTPTSFVKAATALEATSRGQQQDVKKTPTDAAKEVFTAAGAVRSGCDRLSGKLTEADLDFLREIASQDAANLNAVTRADTVLSKVGGAANDAQLREEYFSSSNTESFVPTAQPSFLGGAESTIINGLADFVVTRAKAEAAKYLQDQVFKTICDAGDIQFYLANVCRAVKQLDPNMTLSSAGAYLKAAALQDLQRIPETALELGDAKSHDDRSAVLLSLVLIRTIANGRMPLDALWSTKGMICPDASGNSSAQFSTNVATAACATSRVTFGIVSQTGWSDASRAQSKRYVALASLLSFEDQRNSKLDADSFNADVPIVLAAIALASDLNTAQQDAKSGSDVQARKRARLDLVASGLGLALSTANLRLAAPAQSPTDAAGAPAKLQATDPTATAPLAALAKSIDFGNKSSANDVAAMTVASQALMGDLSVNLPPELTKVIGFVVEVGSASSSKDVATAIDAAVAPVGSYQSKYQRNVIAVNAFVGGSGGSEWVQQTGDWKGSGTYGVFAPIGVHATTPLWNVLHAGVFVSAIDLGTLVSTRLDAETSATDNGRVGKEPTIGIAQIFAPGLFATLGLFNSPVVLGVGGEVAPQLRQETITDSTGKQTGSNQLTALRGQAFLALDLTLLPF